MEDCIFCKIVEKEIPCFKVWEDSDHLAFLTIEPQKEGHTLVIPKKHDRYIFDMADEDLTKLTLASKKVARILEKAFQPKSGRVGVLLMGDQVNHVHIHLIPMDSALDMKRPAKSVDSTELEKTLSKLKI